MQDGMRAVTVTSRRRGRCRLRAAGDRVDVALTRQIEKGVATTDVVLQHTRAGDRPAADERNDKPSIAKAVTLEVDIASAQKLALAASVGTLSLMLRKAGEANNQYTRKITLSDLGAPTTPTAAPQGPVGVTTVGVRRASTREEYSVPIEGFNLHVARDGGR